MWKIKFNPQAEKALYRLERQAKQRLESFMDDLKIRDNQRCFGSALSAFHYSSLSAIFYFPLCCVFNPSRF